MHGARVVPSVWPMDGVGVGGWVGGWAGMRAKKVCVPKMGLSSLALYFKIAFFPGGKFAWFWVCGLFGLGGGVRQITPPPPPPAPRG